MAESIKSRVARIVAGNVHSLIDALENAAPEAGMAQAIREVEGIIGEVSAGLGRIAATRHLAVTRLTEQNQSHEQLSREIDVAIREGRDDLAKEAISRQMDIEAQIPILEQAISNSTAEEKEMESYAIALRAKKREMEEGLRQFVATRAAQNSSDVTGASGASGVSGVPGATASRIDDKMARAESVFDRILAHQTGLPGISSGTSAASAAKLRELSELARSNRVEERLAALKEKG
ncbi:MAG: PspA/IM30 family protein [Candidatus Accumulibacter sp.]|jgi:phage shock protein A|nr:PspA/IM30 family protein [Accumulibacter sp.]